jgi:thiamine biosynthesis lipoprotein ApbE
MKVFKFKARKDITTDLGSHIAKGYKFSATCRAFHRGQIEYYALNMAHDTATVPCQSVRFHESESEEEES